MEYRQHRHIESTGPTRKFSSRQEKTVAKVTGGKQTKNSGATMWQKGDVIVDKDNTSFLLECKTKTSDSKSITIHKEWLDKLKNESLFSNKKYEALIFDFGPNSDKKYAIIDFDLFNRLIELLDKYDIN